MGQAGQGGQGTAWRGAVWFGGARLDVVRQGGFGLVRWGKPRQGEVGRSRPVASWIV